MPAVTRLLLSWLGVLAVSQTAAAFGAGEVPEDSLFKEYVWRHGDIAEVLRFVPSSLNASHPQSFTQSERKQIYFGNWLRDFSQIMDRTTLDKIPEPLLRGVVSMLGLKEFGSAKGEFKVTKDRLRCYQHVEHIDNPRGYANDANEVDSCLRGPVDPRELEFDPETGMKNYISHDGQGYDTAAQYITRELEQAIILGRQGRGGNRAAQLDAFRHLGGALHTLEDFSAHSNFVELCLWQMGETDIFPFVGDACRVQSPDQRAIPPLVTGTFGMTDIFHSLLGEVDDKAIVKMKGSLDELQGTLKSGQKAVKSVLSAFKKAVKVFLTGKRGDSLRQKLEAIDNIFEQAKRESQSVGNVHARDTSGDATNNTLWAAADPILSARDEVDSWLNETSSHGGIHSLFKMAKQKVEDLVQDFVFQLLGTIVDASIDELRAVLTKAKHEVDEAGAKSASAEIYQLNSTASDPSHSDISKDHFSHVLNPPAGLVATVTTNWVTQQIVRCWDDADYDAERTIQDILMILHHPFFPRQKTDIQNYMFQVVEGWWSELTDGERNDLRNRLTLESVKQRGQEIQDFSLKDIQGKKKGPGQFPGFWTGASFPTTAH